MTPRLAYIRGEAPTCTVTRRRGCAAKSRRSPHEKPIYPQLKPSLISLRVSASWSARTATTSSRPMKTRPSSE